MFRKNEIHLLFSLICVILGVVLRHIHSAESVMITLTPSNVSSGVHSEGVNKTTHLFYLVIFLTFFWCQHLLKEVFICSACLRQAHTPPSPPPPPPSAPPFLFVWNPVNMVPSAVNFSTLYPAPLFEVLSSPRFELPCKIFFYAAQCFKSPELRLVWNCQSHRPHFNTDFFFLYQV